MYPAHRAAFPLWLPWAARVADSPRRRPGLRSAQRASVPVLAPSDRSGAVDLRRESLHGFPRQGSGEMLVAAGLDRFEGRIAPLLYRAYDYEQLSWILPQFQIIDFACGFDDGCRDLLGVWGVQYTSTDPS